MLVKITSIVNNSSICTLICFLLFAIINFNRISICSTEIEHNLGNKSENINLEEAINGLGGGGEEEDGDEYERVGNNSQQFNKFLNKAAGLESKETFHKHFNVENQSDVNESDYYFNFNDVKEEKQSLFWKKIRPLSPVILVPGYGGSKLEARWRKTNSQHYFCSLNSPHWSTIWLDIKQLLPLAIDCFVENLTLKFDAKTNATFNRDGVEIRVKQPNSLETVERITDGLFSFNYFEKIAQSLIKYLGYKENVNIRGAPYDFRKAPNEMRDYFDNMKKMIQDMYVANFKRRITFICHSMGCNNVLYFLQNQTKTWKDQYVRRIISLAAPWAGSMYALRAVVFGDNLNLPLILDETKLKIVQRSLPSTIYLFPNKEAFGDRALITTFVSSSQASTKRGHKSQVFRATPEDYEKFFEKIQYPDGYKIYSQTESLLNNLEAPGVEVWCLYGHKQATLSAMEFQGDFPDSTENKIYDGGDGTVSSLSLEYCNKWANKQKEPVHLRGYDVNHLDILKSLPVILQIKRILADVSSSSKFSQSEFYDDYDAEFQS